MQTKTTLIIAAIATLVIGLVIGRCLSWNRDRVENRFAYHMMPDGTMMNGGATMDMDQMMNAMMSGISNKTGDAFDQEFLSEMIVHHQGAVEMAQAVLTHSKRPELIKLANDIIAAQTNEIGMMKKWQKDWFGK